jgi:hypothetical protein
MKRKKENEAPEQEQVGGQEAMSSWGNGNRHVQPEICIDFDTDGMHIVIEVGEAELDFLLNREETESLMRDMERWMETTRGEGHGESGASA